MRHTVVYLIRYTVCDVGHRSQSQHVNRQRPNGVEIMLQIPTVVDPNPPEGCRDKRRRCGAHLFVGTPKPRLTPLLPGGHRG
jgi:hypothetical protein